MRIRQTLRGGQYAFADLRELLAKANEEKSGDQLAGIAADSERERVAAKLRPGRRDAGRDRRPAAHRSRRRRRQPR